MAADTAALMLTHDGARFLRQQLESIFGQRLLPAALVVVDDASTDNTRDLLREARRTAPVPMEILEVDGTGLRDVASRIAGNLAVGLAAVSGHEFVLLADQDDEWLEDRAASQRRLLQTMPGALLVAGDGILVDAGGRRVPGSLREAFPPPHDWEEMDAGARMRSALRRPLVTGAAAALTMELGRLLVPIPRGWLHDRWATLVAAARGGLLLQAEPVIRYRIHGNQAVGLLAATTGRGQRRWQQVLARGSSPLSAAVRASDVVRRLRPIASDPGVRAELTWRAVLGSGLDST